MINLLKKQVSVWLKKVFIKNTQVENIVEYFKLYFCAEFKYFDRYLKGCKIVKYSIYTVKSIDTI